MSKRDKVRPTGAFRVIGGPANGRKVVLATGVNRWQFVKSSGLPPASLYANAAIAPPLKMTVHHYRVKQLFVGHEAFPYLGLEGTTVADDMRKLVRA